MKSIDEREFRKHVYKYVRLAKRGEVFELTKDGEPIAMLRPIEKAD